jgi:hypothetical protein
MQCQAGLARGSLVGHRVARLREGERERWRSLIDNQEVTEGRVSGESCSESHQVMISTGTIAASVWFGGGEFIDNQQQGARGKKNSGLLKGRKDDDVNKID